jgi:hypothetical protein
MTLSDFAAALTAHAELELLGVVDVSAADPIVRIRGLSPIAGRPAEY